MPRTRQALADEAFDGWFQSILADPPEGVRRILQTPIGAAVAPREQLRGGDADACASTAIFPRPGGAMRSTATGGSTR